MSTVERPSYLVRTLAVIAAGHDQEAEEAERRATELRQQANAQDKKAEEARSKAAELRNAVASDGMSGVVEVKGMLTLDQVRQLGREIMANPLRL